MDVSNGVALAATLGSPAVAAIAIWANHLNSRAERANALRLARGSRRFDTRSQVYEEVLSYMKDALAHADDVMEIVSVSPMSALPAGEHLEEQQKRAEVRGAILGSPEVMQKVTEFFSKLRGIRYEANVSMIALRRRQDATDSLRKMHAYRDEASDALMEAETMMREELEGL
jgi:hypothetical protein